MSLAGKGNKMKPKVKVLICDPIDKADRIILVLNNLRKIRSTFIYLLFARYFVQPQPDR